MNDYNDIEDLDETTEDTIVLDLDDDTDDIDDLDEADLETSDEDEDDYDEYEDDEDDDDEDEDDVTSAPVTTFALTPLRDEADKDDEDAADDSDEVPEDDTDLNEDADDETSADTKGAPFRIDIDTDGLDSTAVEAISSVNDVVTVKSDAYSVRYTHISPHQVVGTKPIKDYRSDTYSGLFNVVREMGVIVPIVVTPLAEYADFLADNNITTGAEADELGYTGPRYRVLDGWRRIFASLKNHYDEIPAAVITFHDPEVGRDLSNLMHLVLNRAQTHTWAEKWAMLQVMEESYSLTPSMLDWLLLLEAGDSMRLKEVMLAEYPEVTEDFLAGKKDLTRSYKALEKLRKAEANPTAGDDDRKISSVDEAGDLATDDTEDAPLTDEEVKNLLEMGDELREVRDLLNTTPTSPMRTTAATPSLKTRPNRSASRAATTTRTCSAKLMRTPSRTRRTASPSPRSYAQRSSRATSSPARPAATVRASRPWSTSASSKPTTRPASTWAAPTR